MELLTQLKSGSEMRNRLSSMSAVKLVQTVPSQHIYRQPVPSLLPRQNRGGSRPVCTRRDDLNLIEMKWAENAGGWFCGATYQLTDIQRRKRRRVSYGENWNKMREGTKSLTYCSGSQTCCCKVTLSAYIIWKSTQLNCCSCLLPSIPFPHTPHQEQCVSTSSECVIILLLNWMSGQ